MTAATPSVRRRGRRAAVAVVVGLALATTTGAAAVLADVWPEEWPQSWVKADDDVEAALAGDAYYASPIAVCDLLDGDDLALALGRAHHDGVVPGITPAFAGVPGITKCAYPREDGRGAVQTGVVYAYAEQIYAEVREQAAQRAVGAAEPDDADDPEDGHAERGDADARGDEGIVDVDAGDDAFYDPPSGEMYVLADGNIFAVVVGRGELERTEDRVERYRRLVETAIGRMR